MASTNQELAGRIAYRGSESPSEPHQYAAPFPAAYAERALEKARIVASSNAFAQCVATTMDAQYMNCSDPNQDFSREDQIDLAWDHFRAAQTRHIQILHTRAALDGSEFSGPFGEEYGTCGISVQGHYNEDFEGGEGVEDWDTYAQFKPWNFRAAGMIHEFTHELNYWHTDDNSSQAACAARNGRASYYERGEPSLPYIYGDCAGQLIEDSYRQCRGSCPAGQMKLLASWTGVASDDQTSTACQCVKDPRHVVALRSTTTGQVVTALNGGNDELRTNWSANIGAWQWLYVFDYTGQNWRSNEVVSVRAFNADLFPNLADATDDSEGYVGLPGGSAYFTATSQAPFGLQFKSSGTIRNGSVVQIKAAGTYAKNDGAHLARTSNAADPATQFEVIEPRREHLVYLRSFHGNYVHRDAAGQLYNTLTDADMLSTDLTRRSSAAFWVIDWNGGDLRDGDKISLESFQDGKYQYLSVRDGDHLGHARLSNTAGPFETFTVNILDGSAGKVTYSNDGRSGNDHNRISLRSENGTYLTAMPSDYYASQIRNYSTVENAWQGFDLIYVQEYDRHRAAW
ncbi:MAG: hypothetical protein AB7K71_19350 [Polyangiaceae bacterium]